MLFTKLVHMVQDTEKIKETLSNYIQRVNMGTEQENEFLQHELTQTYKQNSFIGKALAEMDWTEKKTIFKDSPEEAGQKPERDSAPADQQQGSADSYMQAYKNALDKKQGNS